MRLCAFECWRLQGVAPGALTELNVGHNSIGAAGVTILSTFLRRADCRLAVVRARSAFRARALRGVVQYDTARSLSPCRSTWRTIS